jgi:molybdenum cofactor guanylyltransferase
MFDDITGIILSGGKSTRMGTNKSLLKINGITLIERTVNLMKELFSENYLITNEPDDYEFLDITKHTDIYPELGPLSGIHSGLYHSKTEKNFIISCDIPLRTPDIISFIADYPTESKIIIPKADGYVQHLCGIYCKSLLPTVELVINKAEKKKCNVSEVIKMNGAEIIDSSTIPDYKDGMFLNMNDVYDYEEVVNLLKN